MSLFGQEMNLMMISMVNQALHTHSTYMKASCGLVCNREQWDHCFDNVVLRDSTPKMELLLVRILNSMFKRVNP